MNKSLAIYITLALLGISLVIIFNEEINLFRLKNEIAIENVKKRNDSLRIASLKYLVLTHGDCININLKGNFLLTDSGNRYSTLKETIGNRKKYVYHFDETSCFECVEKYLPFLEKLSSKVGKDNILILGSYRIPRYLFLALAKYQLNGIPAYNLDPSYLQNEKISQINSPYIFAVDSTLKVSQIYIPEKGLPDMSELYNDMSFFH